MAPVAAAPILLLFFGAVVLIWAYLASRRHHETFDRRVGLVTPTKAEASAGERLRGRSEMLGRGLRSFFAAGTARTWGMTIGGLKLVMAAAIAAAAVWLLAHVALAMPIVVAAPLAAAAGYMVPRILIRREQAQAESAFQELFPDTVDTVARMLRAGIPISGAVRSIGNEAAPPVSTVFNRIADEVEIGARIEEALDAASRRIGLGDFRFFAVAVALQYATGGNLVSTLDILSNIIRRRRAVRLKAHAATAEIRVSAYVLGALPLLIIGGLALVQPDYLAPLFTDARGHVILGIAAGGMLLAFLTMRQLMRGVTANA